MLFKFTILFLLSISLCYAVQEEEDFSSAHHIINNAQSYLNESSVNSQSLKCFDGACEVAESSTFSAEQFNSVIGTLSAAMSSSKDFHHERVFSGVAQFCNYHPLHYSDCCQFEGWGQSLHLAACKSDEKKLHLDWKEGRCIFLGKYCSHKTGLMKICREYRDSYCCFQSKLARVVQQQGRSQMNKNFGSPKSPYCSGFTVSELQHLDFEKIDLREISGELMKDVRVSENFSVIPAKACEARREVASRGCFEELDASLRWHDGKGWNDL